MKSSPVVLSRKAEAEARGGLNFSAALESPCASCDETPCCSFLPLPGFPVETLMQVDHARWLLGFGGIELGIAATGDWSVFYTASCRFLDPADRSCTLHGTSAQPRICTHYNPYTCWYRGALGLEPSGGYLRIDANRLQVLLPHLLFDDDRNLIGVPTWEALHELLADTPIVAVAPSRPEPDPAIGAWRDIALGRIDAPPPSVRSADEIGDPCMGCAAHCCTTLQFPIEPPSAQSGVDYLRFALGFPDVEIGVADDGWSLLIQTRCRHLEGTRCGLYGSPERPLRCQYFDGAHCPYPTLLGEARPQGFVRVGLDRFAGLEAALRYDGLGNLVELPAAETVRASIEDLWRKELESVPST